MFTTTFVWCSICHSLALTEASVTIHRQPTINGDTSNEMGLEVLERFHSSVRVRSFIPSLGVPNRRKLFAFLPSFLQLLLLLTRSDPCSVRTPSLPLSLRLSLTEVEPRTNYAVPVPSFLRSSDDCLRIESESEENFHASNRNSRGR